MLKLQPGSFIQAFEGGFKCVCKDVIRMRQSKAEKRVRRKVMYSIATIFLHNIKSYELQASRTEWEATSEANRPGNVAHHMRSTMLNMPKFTLCASQRLRMAPHLHRHVASNDTELTETAYLVGETAPENLYTELTERRMLHSLRS